MRIQTVQGDITKQKDVQAIVNAANTSLLGGDGSLGYDDMLKWVLEHQE